QVCCNHKISPTHFSSSCEHDSICQRCAATWFITEYEQGRDATCPFCRVEPDRGDMAFRPAGDEQHAIMLALAGCSTMFQAAYLRSVVASQTECEDLRDLYRNGPHWDASTDDEEEEEQQQQAPAANQSLQQHNNQQQHDDAANAGAAAPTQRANDS